MNGSIFSKMSDSRAVVQFVKEIEKHPCLYDQKSIDYVNRMLKRKTWIQIAKKANSTVVECKEKWRKIRIAYMRTLKPICHNGVRTQSRPYYLASYLKFIAPAKKRYPDNNNQRSVTEDKEFEVTIESEPVKDIEESNDSAEMLDQQDTSPQHQIFMDMDNNCFENEQENEICYDDVVDSKETVLNEINEMKKVLNRNEHNSGPVDHYSAKIDHNIAKVDHNIVKVDHNIGKVEHNNTKVDHIISKIDHIISKNDHSLKIDHSSGNVGHNIGNVGHNIGNVGHNIGKVGHSSSKVEKRKNCCENIECNPRKMFLLSLLPDIEALTEQQMRAFRREVIDLFDKVVYG